MIGFIILQVEIEHKCDWFSSISRGSGRDFRGLISELKGFPGYPCCVGKFYERFRHILTFVMDSDSKVLRVLEYIHREQRGVAGEEKHRGEHRELRLRDLGGVTASVLNSRQRY